MRVYIHFPSASGVFYYLNEFIKKNKMAKFFSANSEQGSKKLTPTIHRGNMDDRK